MANLHYLDDDIPVTDFDFKMFTKRGALFSIDPIMIKTPNIFPNNAIGSSSLNTSMTPISSYINLLTFEVKSLRMC